MNENGNGDAGKNRNLYLLVGELKGKLDQIAQKLDEHYQNLTRQIVETNERIAKLEDRLEKQQEDINTLKTREKIYRSLITFILSVVVMIIIALIR